MLQIKIVNASWLFLFASLSLSPYLVAAQPISQDVNTINRYTAVVDCGSSGTRVHIYHWQVNATNGDLVGDVRPLKNATNGESIKKSIKPGLSSVRDSPESASDYMRPIMDFLTTHVPVEAQQQTAVFFMGTAGLRMLSSEEQRDILNDILKDLTREYNFPRLSAEVITGKEEGLFQWISVNSHAGRLKPAYDMMTGVSFYCQAPLARRLGVLEMGGASAQVTFELAPELDYAISYSLKHSPAALQAYKLSQILIRAGKKEKTVRVFSTSFLGLGANSAREIAVDLLVREAIKLPSRQANSPRSSMPPIFFSPNSTLLLEDPCLPSGAEEDMLKPVELLYNQTHALDYSPQEGEETFTVKLLGRGDYRRCRALLHRLLFTAKQEKLNCEPDRPCFMSLLGTQFVPFRQFQFLGLSDLYYTTNLMIKASGFYDAHLVQRRTDEICATPYATLLKQYPEANKVDKKRTLLECFKATWILTWLHTGLGLPSKFPTDFRTANEINGDAIDWTLGAAIERVDET